MNRGGFLCAAIMLGSLTLMGCASARHVETHPDGGVVAIPANSNSWPFYHRDKAMALIAQSAPEGYDITLEEEAVSGVVTHTRTETRTKPGTSLLVGGFQMHDKANDGEAADYHGSAQFSSVALPLREGREHTTEHKHETETKEWRIHYRRKGARDIGDLY